MISQLWINLFWIILGAFAVAFIVVNLALIWHFINAYRLARIAARRKRYGW